MYEYVIHLQKNNAQSSKYRRKTHTRQNKKVARNIDICTGIDKWINNGGTPTTSDYDAATEGKKKPADCRYVDNDGNQLMCVCACLFVCVYTKDKERGRGHEDDAQ